MNTVIDMDKEFIRTVKELDVYKKPYAISLAVHRASLLFPKIEQFALADQLRRATKSVCANLAEGFAKQQQSKTEFKRFIVMAIGSCNETMVWLDYAFDLEYIDQKQFNNWHSEYDIIYKMLINLRNKIKT